MMKDRYWQLDAVRGVAIVGMVVYHFLVDLEMLFQVPIGVYKAPVVILARMVAILFIALAGILAKVKFERIKNKGLKNVLFSFGKRALEILFWAGVISLVTYKIFPSETIVMGILHFLGISMLLIVPWLYVKNNLWLGMIAIFIFISAIFIPAIDTTRYWLLPFGVAPKTFTSFDYFPLIPWFGVLILGVIIGKRVSNNLEGKVSDENGTWRLLTKIGQKSLLVYLLHQPVMWGLMIVMKELLGK